MTVVVTGAAGQDGRLLSDLLAARGRRVLGLGRGGPVDITDPDAVDRLIAEERPEQVYLLAAVQHSSEDPPAEPRALATASHRVNTMQVQHFAEAIERHRTGTRLFYAASAHVFGAGDGTPCTEETGLRPSSIYGVTKAAGLLACRAYRARGLFASAGILFNHESPLRAEKFVTRKIVRAVARIVRGEADELVLGRLDAGADWGYAPDYVGAMTRILALDEPDEFVVATGRRHTVAEFCAAAFGLAGLDWKHYVRESPSVLTRQQRPLVGDAGRLRARTGWTPSVDFLGMVRAMLAAEGVRPQAESRPVRAGGTDG
ncbi:GDP-mannose 4,6-dehydratase [Nocardia arthritidis]|uniref:GDP-mannose 4,6-dehydratase n=1 Tax=Nocardia arthritidis TaxID=228602 RepID=A0A6G9YGU6_9NOCA|nr:GDP-mannose 4,6-dehydratase [Nocardia arthritidis]QIS12370.1 NAD-dependent epimerase/dehydratase family protein [Nocardia arthritidis]